MGCAITHCLLYPWAGLRVDMRHSQLLDPLGPGLSVLELSNLGINIGVLAWVKVVNNGDSWAGNP